jgi:hypothetical protein
MRGRGTNPYSRRRLLAEDFNVSHEPRRYKVELKYLDGSRERMEVIAHCPRESISEARLMSKHPEWRPVEVISTNSIGETFKKIGKGAIKVAHATGKIAQKVAVGTAKAAAYGVKAGKYGVATYRQAREAYKDVLGKDRKLRELIRNSYSDDIVTQTTARAQLRREYPQIYQELGFVIAQPWSATRGG